MKAELDKMHEARDQAINLYESLDLEMVKLAEKENEYIDRLNKMGVKLEAKSAFELRLLDDNEALKVRGEGATERVTADKKKAEEECARANEFEKRAEIATI